MTAPQRFEHELPALLADLYVGGLPDYRDDLLRTTAATRQRPAWSFPTRWLPMDLTMRRLPAATVPWRLVGVALLVAALVAAAVYVGSQRKVPPPFGPARNGPMAYGRADAIYARDTAGASERLLIGAAGRKVGSWGFSPDGTQILFQETIDGKDFLMAANADGTNQRRILDTPVHDDYVAWAPDGRSVAVSDGIGSDRHAMFVHLDGSPATTMNLGGASPTDLAWRPPDGTEVLVRASRSNGTVDLYRVRPDGTLIGTVGIADSRVFGVDYDVSGPTWSPSGDRIAYNQVEPFPGVPGDGHFRVHLVSVDGSNDVTLPAPAEPNINQAWPIWSPDGKSIAVERFIFADVGIGWLAIVPSDGSGAGRDVMDRLRGAGGLVKTWSPDGTRLLAYAKDAGNTYLIDPAAGASEQLTWTGSDLPDYQRLAP